MNGTLMSEQEIKKNFSTNLQHCLKSKRINQSRAAADLHIKVTRFNSWCTGVSIPDARYLYYIASYFGVKIEDLLLPARKE